MTLAAAESGTAFRAKSQRGQKKVSIFLPFFIGLQVCERGKSTMCTLHCLAVAKKSIGRNISSSSSTSLLLALVLPFGISGKYWGGDTWREGFWGLGVHLRRRLPSQSHNTRLPPFLLCYPRLHHVSVV